MSYLEIKRNLNKNDRTVIRQILSLFREVDRQAKLFKKLTGIQCPQMCGMCCFASGIETTVVEMLPLALYLWSRNEADLFLNKLDNTAHPGQCIFFNPDTPIPGNGRCRVYKLRPLICRLFGFFTVKDKYDNYVYGSCKIIKQSYPANYQKAKELIEEGFHPSNMTDFMIRVISMGSDSGKKMLPINIACRVAIERIGFYAGFVLK